MPSPAVSVYVSLSWYLVSAFFYNLLRPLLSLLGCLFQFFIIYVCLSLSQILFLVILHIHFSPSVFHIFLSDHLVFVSVSDCF